MKQIYELDKKDIASIIAEKYKVSSENVSINIEHIEADRPYESSYDRVTATVTVKEDWHC